MLKRLWTLLLALLLLAGLTPAHAQESASPVVALLDGAGQAVGQGILLGDGTELLLPMSLTDAAGLQVSPGIALTGLAAQSAEAAVARLNSKAGEALPLAAEDPAVFSQVQAVNAAGAAGDCTVLTWVSLEGGWGFTFRDESGAAEIGGALLNDRGEVAGMVLGTWAELPNAKVALGAEAIAALQAAAGADVIAALPEAEAPAAPDAKQDEPATPGEKQAEPATPDEKKNEPAGPGEKKDEPTAPGEKQDEPGKPGAQEGTVFLKDVALTMRGADEMEVDWAGSDITDLRGDSTFLVYYGDVDTPYVWIVEATAQESSCMVDVIPGRTYMVWVQHGHGQVDSSLTPSEAEIATCVQYLDVPEASAFNKYGYTQDDMYLCLVSDSGEAQPAASTFTDAELSRRGQSLTLNVTSCYRVRQDVEASLAVSVITPLGECYDTWGGFLFEEALEEDVWNISLNGIQDTYLEYNQNWTPGVYLVTVYFDGAWVAETQFIVE